TFWKVIGAANGIVSQVPELLTLSGWSDRLAEFEGMAEPTDQRECDHIEMNNVSFHYDGKDVLERLDLTIQAGERLLILGPNGSGKTTLGHILAGFLQPSRGAARLPGLKRISAMLSPFHFAPGSLKDNVRYNELSDEKKELFRLLVNSLGLESRT